MKTIKVSERTWRTLMLLKLKRKAKSIESLLKEILTDKISFLRDIIEDIDVQIKDRGALKDGILKKLDEGICYLRTQIYLFFLNFVLYLLNEISY